MARFVPRERKHKVLARAKKRQLDDGGHSAEADTNKDETLPQEQLQKGRAERDSLKQLDATSKVSGKKKKRLEKYIVGIIIFCYSSCFQCFDTSRLQN